MNECKITEFVVFVLVCQSIRSLAVRPEDLFLNPPSVLHHCALLPDSPALNGLLYRRLMIDKYAV
jgi:hypothetical protein